MSSISLRVKKFLSSAANRNKASRARRNMFIETLENRSLLATITGGTGPGGLFSTDGTSSLSSWLKADSIAQPTGTAVTTWLDSSGHNNNATSLPASAPIFDTVAALNGNPRLNFGPSQFFTLPMPAQLGIQNSDYEIISVAGSPSNSVQFVIAGAIENYEMHLDGGAGLRFIPVNAGDPAGYSDIGVAGQYTSATGGAAQLFSGRLDPNQGNRGIARVNGVDTADITAGSGVSANNTPLVLGRRVDGSYNIAGYIAETLIFDRSLNSAERTIIDNSLSAKYNTPLDASVNRYSGDDAALGNFDRDVFGVGRVNATNLVTSAGSGGVGIEVTGSLDDGEFAMAGHKVITNSLVSSDLPINATSNSRWDRVWYVDVTGTFDANLAFDFSDAGLSMPVATSFKLLYQPTNAFEAGDSPFIELPLVATVVGDRVVFNVPAGLPQDGYFTLGIQQVIAGGTGPGGLFTTDGSSNLGSWLKADSITQANGTAVNTWVDSSGNNNNATNAGGTAPIFSTVTPINGNPRVNFNGGQFTTLPTPAALGIQNSDYEMIVVGGSPNNATQFVIAGAGEIYEMHLDGAAGLRFIPAGFAGGAGGSDIGVPGQYTLATGGAAQVFSGRLDPNQANRGIARVNGVDSVDLTTGSGISANNTPLVLGRRGDGSLLLNGFIAETLIFDRSLNSAERSIIDNALAAKYNTALTAAANRYIGDDAAQGDYDRDVIGIGRVDASNAVNNAGAAGLAFNVTGSLDDGDFVLAGHKTATNSLVTTDLPAGLSQRWNRAWYVDATGNVEMKLSFDASEAGVAPAGSTYKLLYTPSNSFETAEVAFTALGFTGLVVGDTVSFSLPAGALADGYYTLGIAKPADLLVSNATTGLISYWNFDEAATGTSTAFDLADNNNGTFQGAATRTTGLIGIGAASFNNSAGAQVNVGAGTSNNFAFSTGIAIEVYVKSNWSGAVNDYDEIFRKEDGGNRILLSFQNDTNFGSANPPVTAGPVLSFGLNIGGVYRELDMKLDGVAGRPTLAEMTDATPDHIIAQYDSTTGRKSIWINGTERFSVIEAGLITSGGGAAGMIGNLGGGGEPFTGVIDELAFYNRPLKSSEIVSHFANLQNGMNYFTQNVDRPSTVVFDLTTSPGVNAVDHWRVNWGDGTTSDVLGNVTSATHAYTAAGTYSIVAKAGYADQLTTPAPIHRWKLNDTNGTAVDSAGSANGTYVGFQATDYAVPAVIQAADADASANFRGNASGTHVQGAINAADLSGDWTIEAWFTRRSIQQWGSIFSNNNGANSAPIMTFIDSTNSIGIMNAGVNANGITVDLGADSLNKPIYAVITKSGGNAAGTNTITVTAYVDGRKLTATGSTYWNLNPNGNYYIGRHYTTATQVLDGTIDEVAIYNTALSAAEIESHYSAGLAKSSNVAVTGYANTEPYTLSLNNPALTSQTNVSGWNIAWGDGTSIDVPRSATTASHLYTTPGNYEIVIRPTSFVTEMLAGTTPTAWWRLNETSGSAVDVIGGRAAAPVNLVPADRGVTGVLGGNSADLATNFHGTTADTYMVGSQPGFANTFAGDWTIEAWFTHRSATQWGTLFSNNGLAGEISGPLFEFILGTNKLGLNQVGVSAQDISVDLGPNHFNKPIYAVITKTGGNAAGANIITIGAVVDGVLLTASGTTYWNLTPHDSFMIGRHYAGGAVTAFDGVIDEIAVYNSALSFEELQSHYYAGITPATEPVYMFAAIDAPLDYGDAPASYGTQLVDNGPRHPASGPMLGAARDVEGDAATPLNGTGDNVTGANDEDGVTFLTTILASNAATHGSSVVVNASGAGRLDAWIDFNGNGVFDDGTAEAIFDNVPVVAGNNVLSFTIPVGATVGNSFARFRVSTAGNLAPTGQAIDGEVEDYAISIVADTGAATATLPPGGGNFEARVNAGNIELIQGATVLLRTPLGTITSLNVEGNSAGETLLVNLATGNAIPASGIVFNSAGGADTLRIAGGSQGDVTYNYTNANSGSVVMSSFGTVSYTGAEAVINAAGSVANALFNLPASAQGTLQDDPTAANGLSRLSSTNSTFTTTDFTAPTTALTLSGVGNAAISLNAFDSTFNTPSLVLAGAATDVYSLGASEVIPNNTSVTVNTATWNLNGRSETIAGLAGNGLVTNTAAGVVALTIGSNNATSTYSGRITNSGGALTLNKTGSGAITLASTSAGNTYTGGTNVNGGTLFISGANNGTSAVGFGILTINVGANVTANSHNALGQGASNLTPLVIDGGSFTPSQYIHLNSLTIRNGGTVLVGLSTGGDGLDLRTLGATLPTVTVVGAATSATIAARMTLRNNVTFNVSDGAAANDLVLSAATQLGQGAAGQFIKTGTGAVLISNGITNVAGGLFVNAGLVAVEGSSRWEGSNITINAGGTFQARTGGGDSIGNSRTVTVNSGGVFDFQQVTNETITALVLNGTGIGGTGALLNSSGNSANLTASSGITLATNSAIGGAGNLTLTGVIGGAGALTKLGANVLQLNSIATYAGDTNITAGTLRLGASDVLPSGAGLGNVSVTSGMLDLNGFSDTINGLSGTGIVDNLAGVGVSTLTLGGGNATASFSGELRDTSGTLAVTKIGDGTQTFTGANNYSGETLVSAGTLLVNNVAGSGTGSGNITVQTGATLGGTGFVTGNITAQSGGTVSPGGTPGTLTTTGNTTLQSGSIYRVELIGTNNDQLVTNGVDLTGAVLDASSDANLGAGTLFVIIDNTSGAAVNGTFAGLIEGASFFINGYQYFITYVHNGNDVAIYRNRPVDAIADQFGPILVNTSFTGNTYANDDDADGDARSTVIAQPLNGKVFMDPATGQFTYTPKPNFIGTDSFTYRLSDGEFNDTATVEITVVPMLVDGSGVLQVSGTTGGDNIIVQAGSVRYNNVTYPLSASRVVVHGGGGNDTISVTASNIAVEFYGEDGDDYLSGGSLNDILDGGAGTDRLLGNAGDDNLYGGGGSDNLSGGVGNDYLSGDGYLDAASVEQQATDAGKDTLSGDAGDDTIFGGAGMDTLLGGIGNDYLSGGEDGDAIDGGVGHDILLGDGGGDKLYGRAGNDVLIGGEGLDTLLGDTGLDLVYGGGVTASLTEATLRAIALQWFTPATQTAAVNQFVAYKQDDLVSDTLNGEADDDWYLLFAKDLIAATERFPGNRKTQL